MIRALWVVAALCASCATTSVERRPWIEVESERFVIRSSLGEAATAVLARDLEAYVTAGEVVFGAPFDAPTRIVVYAYDGRGLERPFDRANQPSWFLSSPIGGVLVLRTGSGFSDATPETRFDLARYLLHGNGGLDTPLWYDEGMSAFLSTARRTPRHTLVGEPRFDLQASLSGQVWPSANDVLAVAAVDDAGRRQRALFRARAWVIVHFAQLGELPDSAPRPALDLARARDRAIRPTTRAWFGVPSDDFDPALRRHAGTLGATHLALRESQPPSLSGPTPLACGAIAEELGWLALELERDGLARRYYRHALRCDPSSARAYAGMAAAESLREDFEAASQLRNKALSMAPGDPRVQILAGRSLEWTARETGARADLAAARAHYRAAAAASSDDPEPRTRFARSVLGDERATLAQTREALTALEQSQRLLPGALDVTLDRARAHARLNERSAARDLARSVATRTDEEALRDAAHELLDRTARTKDTTR